MNVIIDPTDNMGYSITSEIGRNILKNYLTNYKNGGNWSKPEIISVSCSSNSDDGSVLCSSKPKELFDVDDMKLTVANGFISSKRLKDSEKPLKEFEDGL